MAEDKTLLVGDVSQDTSQSLKMSMKSVRIGGKRVKLLKEIINCFTKRTDDEENKQEDNSYFNITKDVNNRSKENVKKAKDQKILPNKCSEDECPCVNKLQFLFAFKDFIKRESKKEQVKY